MIGRGDVNVAGRDVYVTTEVALPSIVTADFTDTFVSSLKFIPTSTQMLPSLPVL